MKYQITKTDKQKLLFVALYADFYLNKMAFPIKMNNSLGG